MRKKDNMAYWDEIDEVVLNFLKEISRYSYTRIKQYYEEDEEDWEEYDEDSLELTDEFVWASNDVRDFVVKYLEKNFKAWFPFVDEEYWYKTQTAPDAGSGHFLPSEEYDNNHASYLQLRLILYNMFVNLLMLVFDCLHIILKFHFGLFGLIVP